MSSCNEILNKKTLVLENLVMDFTILRHPLAIGFRQRVSEDVGRVPIKCASKHEIHQHIKENQIQFLFPFSIMEQ
jgi:hypothetical protein